MVLVRRDRARVFRRGGANLFRGSGCRSRPTSGNRVDRHLARPREWIGSCPGGCGAVGVSRPHRRVRRLDGDAWRRTETASRGRTRRDSVACIAVPGSDLRRGDCKFRPVSSCGCCRRFGSDSKGSENEWAAGRDVMGRQRRRQCTRLLVVLDRTRIHTG